MCYLRQSRPWRIYPEMKSSALLWVWEVRRLWEIWVCVCMCVSASSSSLSNPPALFLRSVYRNVHHRNAVFWKMHWILYLYLYLYSPHWFYFPPNAKKLLFLYFFFCSKIFTTHHRLAFWQQSWLWTFSQFFLSFMVVMMFSRWQMSLCWTWSGSFRGCHWILAGN